MPTIAEGKTTWEGDAEVQPPSKTIVLRFIFYGL